MIFEQYIPSIFSQDYYIKIYNLMLPKTNKKFISLIDYYFDDRNNSILSTINMIYEINNYFNDIDYELYMLELNNNNLTNIMHKIKIQITILDNELAQIGMFHEDRKIDNWLMFLNGDINNLQFNIKISDIDAFQLIGCDSALEATLNAMNNKFGDKLGQYEFNYIGNKIIIKNNKFYNELLNNGINKKLLDLLSHEIYFDANYKIILK